MERKFWASRGRTQMGPFTNRDDALIAFRAEHPMKPTRRNLISTGYGEFGPHFDIRFDAAAADWRDEAAEIVAAVYAAPKHIA